MSSIGGHVDHLTRGAVWLIGTLDTKGAEAAFLKDIVQQHGLNARVIDVGVLGIPGMDADVTRAKPIAVQRLPLCKEVWPSGYGINRPRVLVG
jgi:hypothetical protein